EARVSGALVDHVLGRTGGVPLFVEQLTRNLLDNQGQRAIGEELGDEAVPESLRDLLNGSLGQLGAAKETAQIAAAIGREFEMELWGLVSSRDGDLLQADLDQLVEARLVDRYWHATGSRYVFRHGLFREAAWESMLSAHRRAVHRTIADAIEARFPAQAGR